MDFEKRKMDMAMERGKIVSDFSLLEKLIHSFLASYYFGTALEKEHSKKKNDFTIDILCSPFISFYFKMKLFNRILSRDFPEISFPKSELGELCEIRNAVAHGTNVNYIGIDGNFTERSLKFLEHEGELKDFDELTISFYKIYKKS